jgi:hypothetical protein
MGPEKTYAEREKLGRGRWMPSNGSKLARLRNFVGRINRKTRIRLLGILALIVMIILFYVTRKHCSEQITSELALTGHSIALLLAQGKIYRRWQEACNYSGRKPGWWRYGVERTSGVGNRTRQCTK